MTKPKKQTDARIKKIAKELGMSAFKQSLGKISINSTLYFSTYDLIAEKIGPNFIDDYKSYQEMHELHPDNIEHMLAIVLGEDAFRILTTNLHETYISGYSIWEKKLFNKQVNKSDVQCVNGQIANKLQLCELIFIGNAALCDTEANYASSRINDYFDYHARKVPELDPSKEYVTKQTDMQVGEFSPFFSFDDFRYSSLWLLHNIVNESSKPEVCSPFWREIRKIELPEVVSLTE